MGHRDDFYVPANIIGYTGSLTENPTIYFQNGAEFGHITQAHDWGGNVGREKVRTNDTYEITNEFVQSRGATVCVEKENGTIMHTSRNLFQKIFASTDRAIAAQAIIAFP